MIHGPLVGPLKAPLVHRRVTGMLCETGCVGSAVLQIVAPVTGWNRGNGRLSDDVSSNSPNAVGAQGVQVFPDTCVGDDASCGVRGVKPMPPVPRINHRTRNPDNTELSQDVGSRLEPRCVANPPAAAVPSAYSYPSARA